MMRKVLIANRGEIACRIIRSCRELGYSPVAVHSEADTMAQHVLLADQAWPIGPAPVRESYLDITAILTAARRSGAHFIHPGYGLLSENPAFAAAVEDAGIGWIGPSAETVATMADKGRARQIAVSLGIPVLPGSPAIDAEDSALLEAAGRRIGFPVLVKAVAGGGGIGMRLVEQPDHLVRTARAVAALAARNFGQHAIFLERHVGQARHIEIQLFGLGDGRAFHLFERDCSIQRRYQKVIEEAPAPRMSERIRQAMLTAALRLARSQSYAGAGTVEFIVDDTTGAFYFLEMNTRIQVEHAATEMVTGHDIVALQLRLAAGEALAPLLETPVRLRGHAIECRLYAENPARNFFPAPGRLDQFEIPDEAPGLRIDSGVVEGDTVTPHYDPMLAKIIVSGDDRRAACARMTEALAEIRIGGITTNLEFLRRVVAHPDFKAARVDTGFVERHMHALTA